MLTRIFRICCAVALLCSAAIVGYTGILAGMASFLGLSFVLVMFAYEHAARAVLD